MKQFNLRQLLYTSSWLILFALLCSTTIYANNPCDAYKYDFTPDMRDTVPCGRTANTIKDIDVDAAGTTNFQLEEICESLLPAPHDYVTWFTFVIQEGGGSFEWQIIETGRDDVNYEIYYSNDVGGPNECTDLTYYTCGDHFITWEHLAVPNPDIPTRFYVAMFTEKADDDVTVNLKVRKACNEACNRSDIAVVAAEDRCIDSGESTILAASPSGGGDSGTYTYLWSPNDGSIDNINSPIPTVSPSVTTTYTVQVRGEDGCPAFDKVTVQVGECCLMPPTIECPPRYVGCPGSSLDPYVTGSPTITQSEASCSDVKLIYSDEILNQDQGCEGARKIRRTWTATYYDFPDLETSCEQIIVLKDNQAPRITFDDPRLIDLISGDTIRVECDTILPFDMNSAIITDNCGDDNVTVEFDDFVSEVGDCLVDRFNWIMDCRWRATDACGNMSDFQIIVIIEDTTPPQPLWTPADVTTTCDAIPPVDDIDFFENCSYDVDVQFEEISTLDECEGNYTITRIWTASDICQNVIKVTQNIYVVDDVAPYLYGVPGHISVSCDEIPAAATGISASDNCDDNVTITFSESIQDGDCANHYIINRQWTATDNCGNQTVDNQQVSVEDNTPPSLSYVPNDATVSCDNVPTAPTVTATDNCDDNVTVTFSESVQNGNCTGNYLIMRKWSASDVCGNTTSDIQVLTVQDNTPPVLQNVPDNATVSCDNISDPNTVTAVDNCDNNVTVTFSESSDQNADCASGYTITRKWTATDDCGNSTFDVQLVTVQDNEAPTFQNVPQNATANCDNIPTAPTVTATDNCDDNVTVTFSESVQNGNCAGDYTITRSWTATDDCGNQAVDTQTITVQDNTAPAFWDIPQNTTADCDNIPDAPTVTATDNCDDNVAVYFSESVQNGNCAGNYTITRTWTTTDDCGNQAVDTQTITVQDNTAPVLWDVPQNIDADCNNIPDAPTVMATDNCDDNVQVTFSESVNGNANDCSSGYSVTRTWTATDDCGNQSAESQVITIRDNTAPTFWDIPQNTTADCDNIPDAPTVTATDNCDDNVTVTFSESVQNGNCAGNYTLTRTWTATDNCGNQAIDKQTITVQDNTAPVLWDVPQNIDADCNNIPDAPTVMATDNCDDNVQVIFSESVNGNANDCSGGYSVTRTWTATDDCGNQSVEKQVITIQDNTAPTLQNVPDNTTVSCDNIPDPTTVTATDNCDQNVEISFNESVQTGDCAGQSTITRKWTATDDCGNQSFDIQLITTTDDVAPVFQNVPENVTVSCDAVPDAAPVTAVDNCDNNVQVVLKETINELDCAGKFNVRRKWTATDDCGNKTTAVQTIKARDNTNPELVNVPADVEISCSEYPTPATVIAVDNCDDNVTVEYTETVNPKNCGDELVRKWVATDACGNKTTKRQRIRRKDDTAPVFVNAPENITVSCNGIPVATTPAVDDDCDNDVEIVYTETVVPKNCAGKYNLRRKWVATDNCGNKSTALQVIKVRDNEKPTLVGVPNNRSVNCSEYPTVPTVTATDDCDDNVVVTFSETTEALACGDKLIRQWTARDACGNTRSAKQIITRTDNAAPVLVGVPADVEENCGYTTSDVPQVTATDDCDNNVQVIFSEENVGGNCGGDLIRRWTATDNCGNTTVKTQTISRNDNVRPTLQNVPDNATVSCDNIPNPATVTATDNCDNNVEISFNESVQNGDCTGESVITRKWTATDDCGNQSFDIQLITVVDNTPPVLVGVPADSNGSCGNGGYQSPPLVTAADNCDDNVQVTFGEEIVEGNCGDDLIRKWTATDDCGNATTKIQRISFSDGEAPVFWDCPNDITLQAQDGCMAKATWNAVSATDNCDDNVTVTCSHPSGTRFNIGTTTVTCTATDDCGNVSYCTFDVTVNGDFGLVCPDDIVTNCTEDGGTYLSWTPPTGTSCCMSCNVNPEVANFLYMGTYGGHRYYCSRDRATWQQAKATAENMGGYLAVINDPAENQYLTSFLGNQNAFIGLTDEGTEGTFRWLNGDPVTYTNWRADQPNNHENNQHYGQLLNTGKWNDTFASDQLEYIVEIPCLDIRQVGGPTNGGFIPTATNTITYQMTDECGNTDQCSFTVTVNEAISISCPDDIVIECDDSGQGAHVCWTPPTLSGCCSDCPQNPAIQDFVYMGTRNGHRYYCSQQKANWQTAQAICESKGGHLAVINDADENAFLTTFLVTQRAFIGLTDQQTEGQFKWANGDPVTYTNWHPGEPDNDNGAQDYVELINNGKWNDTDGSKRLEYILEIPCNDPVQTGGYQNGSTFPYGTTTVTYEASDNCGNYTTCSFDVTVQNCTTPTPTDYCELQGNSTTHAFIHKVNTSAFSNVSSNNQGYADFTHLTTNMTRGTGQSIIIYPGFYNTRRYVYWRGWIDYNQDGDFNDQGETFFQYRHYQSLRINFNVPASAKLGETRMRIAMSVKGYPSSCGAFDYGEVEDYTLNITSQGRLNTGDAIGKSLTANDKFSIDVVEDNTIDWSLNSTSIADKLMEDMPLTVFPNPVSELLTIAFNNTEYGIANVQVFNPLGQLVQTKNLECDSCQTTIDVDGLASGVYTVVVEDVNGVKALQRVVVE